jgi:hypothetical protein
VKTRAGLLASIKPTYWKYLREDAGDLLPGAKSHGTSTEEQPQLTTV